MKNLRIQSIVSILITLLICAFIFLSVYSQDHVDDKKIVLGKVQERSVFSQSEWHIWGADVIKVKNRYYMYYSRWPKETGMAGWLTHSEIALAIADDATGPFEFQQTVLTGANDNVWDAGMVHSPQVLEFEGKYYLYYTGVPKAPQALEIEESRQYLKDTRRLGVAVADTPEGPWQRFDNPLIPTESVGELDSLATANPAILETPEGNFLLIYKGIKQEADKQRISLLAATSPHPLGPFTTYETPILDNNQHVEDPDIWFQEGTYFMIAHDVTGYYSKAPDGRSLALFSSSDGLHWQATDQPLASRRRITLADDTITYFQRFERPHILVEDGKASMLYVAVKEAEGLAHNVAIPVSLK